MKLYSDTTKSQIITLRSKGCTYAEIQEQLGLVIPKSTLSYICAGVTCPASYYGKVSAANAMHLSEIREKAYAANRDKLAERVRESERRASMVVGGKDPLSQDKLALAILYFGEGAKRVSYRGLKLGGSDAAMIQMFIALVERCYGIPRNEMKARIQYRADQDITKLTKYWKKQLGFRKAQFYKTIPDVRTSGKPTLRADYTGVCVVSCRSADIQLELSAIAKQFADKVWGYSSVD